MVMFTFATSMNAAGVWLKAYGLETWRQYIEILTAPAQNPSMIWILIPLVATLLLMEFYFGRYSDEELGWNSAFGNSLVLIFVSIDLFRHLHDTDSLQLTDPRVIVSLSLVMIGALLMFIDFWHLLPKELAYGLSSRLTINFFVYLAIVMVYTVNPRMIQLNEYTAGAFLLVLISMAILIKILHLIEIPIRESLFHDAPDPSAK